MKFRYIGNCEGMTFRGLSFPIDEPVEVTDEADILKLANNTCFAEVKTRKRKVTNDGDSSTDKGQGGL